MLGRGLEALIPEKRPDEHLSETLAPAGELTARTPNAGEAPPSQSSLRPRSEDAPSPVFHIEINKIKPNPDQPRRNFDEEALRGLAASIREFGVLHPIVVSKIEKDTEFGTAVEYQLVAGERRLLASKIAGLERIPAMVRALPPERERLELAVIENIQREDLNPIEAARAFARLQDEFRLTQREIAVRLGKSRESVANTIRLLSLPTEIQEAVAGGAINESQARMLLSVADIMAQQKLFEDLKQNSFSVRELRNRIRALSGLREPGEAVLKERVINPELVRVRQELESLLGTPVALEASGEGGKIVIKFFSPNELRELLARLQPEHERAFDRVDEEMLPSAPDISEAPSSREE